LRVIVEVEGVRVVRGMVRVRVGLGLGSGLGQKQKCERTDCEMEGCEKIGEKIMAVR
jgi:hypothetical protein